MVADRRCRGAFQAHAGCTALSGRKARPASAEAHPIANRSGTMNDALGAGSLNLEHRIWSTRIRLSDEKRYLVWQWIHESFGPPWYRPLQLPLIGRRVW